ncbi:MAG: TetR/AcrR family transcriptional regulator [Parvibaculum sp.]|nr:TetR/AcrR family transcriptional regulator [Parvibaculum sp.]MBO6692392.1 TetR/AcrR family transcriptional regulator [Parvibaculum sp.]MBO6713950.1 TetR/AcrR family transcriptional regulator [Parvibaculum sp.]
MCGSISPPSCSSFRRTEMRGRENQKRRTRKDLLVAASRLLQQGRKPSLEEIAEEAFVSRATAYRYFPNVDQLLIEAALDVATPDPEALFAEEESGDPARRLLMADNALQKMVRENEPQLRMMLAKSLEASLGGMQDVPPRQNRRVPLIEAALEPMRGEMKNATRRTLVHALALLFGTEANIVCKDVLQIGDKEADRIRRWAMQALLDAARKES